MRAWTGERVCLSGLNPVGWRKEGRRPPLGLPLFVSGSGVWLVFRFCCWDLMALGRVDILFRRSISRICTIPSSPLNRRELVQFST